MKRKKRKKKVLLLPLHWSSVDIQESPCGVGEKGGGGLVGEAGGGGGLGRSGACNVTILECTEREVICKYCKRNSFFGLRFDPESHEEFTIADLEQNFYAKTTLGTRAMICCYIDNRSKSDVYYSVKVVYLPGDLAA